MTLFQDIGDWINDPDYRDRHLKPVRSKLESVLKPVAEKVETTVESYASILPSKRKSFVSPLPQPAKVSPTPSKVDPNQYNVPEFWRKTSLGLLEKLPSGPEVDKAKELLSQPIPLGKPFGTAIREDPTSDEAMREMFSIVMMVGAVTPVQTIPGFAGAAKYISPDEAQNYKDLLAGTDKGELFRVGRKNLPQALQRIAGHELLADFDNAMVAKDYNTAKEVIRQTAQTSNLSSYLDSMLNRIAEKTGGAVDYTLLEKTPQVSNLYKTLTSLAFFNLSKEKTSSGSEEKTISTLELLDKILYSLEKKLSANYKQNIDYIKEQLGIPKEEGALSNKLWEMFFNFFGGGPKVEKQI